VVRAGWLAVPRRAFAIGDVVDLVVPGMGDSITEGEIAAWNVAVGDDVNLDDVVVEIETDKVTTEVKAPVPGTITELLAEEGDTVSVNQLLAKMTEGEAIESTPAAAAPTPAAEPVAAEPVSAAAPAAAAAPAVPAAAAAAPATTGSRNETRVPITRIRKRVIDSVKDTEGTAAMLTTFNEIDMSEMIAMRNIYKDDFEKKHGIKFGFMGAFVAAATKALLKFPDVNACIDGTDVLYRDYVDINITVASRSGLVVPVIQNCESLSVAKSEASVQQLAGKASSGALVLEDLMPGTFTISSGDIAGSLFGTPMLKGAQSAILGMHAIRQRAMVIGGKVEVRPMMYVALTYDHRIVDGREGVGFLVHIKKCIEDPGTMLLDL
jgi:2-oxoglutarate dehydrogenase E2 component (dihydrolipoamide succinyltransferase)